MPKPKTNALWWNLVFFLLAGVSAIAHSATADDRRRMIEVAAAPRADSSGDISLNIRVLFTGALAADGSHIDLYVARLRGDVATGAIGNSDEAIPYMDIEFTPVSLGFQGAPSTSMPGDFTFLIDGAPVRIKRNVALGEDLGVEIHVGGFELRTPVSRDTSQRVLAFARVAARALGYKYLAVAEEARALHGFSIAQADIQAGIAGGTADGKFKVSLAFGAQGDANVMGRGDAGVARFQADGSLYSELRAEFLDFFQVFVRGSWNLFILGSQEPRSEVALVAGAGFIF
jgi:hypothetical protein